MLAAIGIAACSSTVGPTAGPSSLLATAAPLPAMRSQTASIGPSPSLASPPTTWRVDVVNGPRPIEIRFNLEYVTPLASGDWDASAWRVEPNARVTLFDQASVARAGSFDLLQTSDDHPILGHCHVFVELPFQAESFTIVIKGDASGPDYTATIEPGQPPLEPIASYPDPNDPQSANCSG